MFVGLIDRLRCPGAHEESWLVATATCTVDRRIVDGALGCPVCGAEYVIRGGAAWFGGTEPVATGSAPQSRLHARSQSRSLSDGPVRLAAMLGLEDGAGIYVLDGAWCACAPGMAAVFPDARFVFTSTADADGASAVLRCTGDAIPLASGSVRGVALDRASMALLEAAERVLAAKGRLVAPAESGVPSGITVLARDDEWWVGERSSASLPSAPVTPRRAVPRTGHR